MAETLHEMMERSVQQGMDYLVDVQNASIFYKKEAIFDIENLFGTSVLLASNKIAKKLEKAIDRDIDLSGAAHDIALKQVFQRAAIGFHAETFYEDKKGVRRPVIDGNIPATAARLVFRF